MDESLTGMNSQTPPDGSMDQAGLASLNRQGSDSTARNPGAGIDYNLFLDCVHCGLCTASCPTYAELGDENDSPRGRIYLMRAVTDGRLQLTPEVRRHLDLCLDCRACESACPSGVQYGRLIEPFRIAMEASGADKNAGYSDGKTDDWFHRRVLLGMFPFPERLRKALRPARLAQRLGFMKLARATRLTRLLPPRLRQLVEMLPPPERKLQPLPEVLPAIGRRRARVAMFTGCVADVFFRRTHWATVRVLQENGCDVVIPRNQVCCGAIHFHTGHSEPAQELSDQNIQAFDREDLDAIIVNVAGCGSMLKDYGHHWNDESSPARQRFAARTRDINEFLDELGMIPPTGELPIKATYHDACHLAHAQQVREAPRRLLRAIPGLTLTELAESELCCGAAGTYNLTEPQMAARLAQRKMNNILTTEADVVATANAGCILQIAREARSHGHSLEIVHPVELLDRSYQAAKAPQPR